MARKIIGGVLIAVVLVAAFLWYRNWKAQSSFGNGDVYPVNTPDTHTGSYSQPNSSAANNVPAPSSTSNQPPGGAPAPVDATTVAGTSSAPPVTDSQAPNNPDNVRIGSASGGHYQWYRQGNLTWRVDTQTGSTCIDFATEDEWRKPRVYQNGCGSH